MSASGRNSEYIIGKTSSGYRRDSRRAAYAEKRGESVIGSKTRRKEHDGNFRVNSIVSYRELKKRG